jgi:hypothetical protein
VNGRRKVGLGFKAVGDGATGFIRIGEHPMLLTIERPKRDELPEEHRSVWTRQRDLLALG